MQNPYWLIIFASLVALVPLILGIFTSYLKVSIVLNILKTGIGAQQVPSNLAIMIASLAITTFVMTPVFSKSIDQAEKFKLNEITKTVPAWSDLKKYSELLDPWVEFMRKHAGSKELEVIKEIDLASMPKNTEPQIEVEQYNFRVTMTAYVLSEIKAGFSMGFLLPLPFLVIDLVVANILAGMGMYMLSPVIISLPLKIIFFVASDGWLLLTKTLIHSYQ